MKKTRREFSWSGLGIGAALAGTSSFAVAEDRSESSRVQLHEDPRLSCFEVNLARADGNEVVATFGRAPVGAEIGDILLGRSRDGGVTWEKSGPVALFTREESDGPHQGYQTAGIARLKDGTLIANTTRFQFLFGGKVRWRRGSETAGVFTKTSTDGGYTWESAQKIATGPFQIAWTRGPIVEMQDGSLLLPLAGQKGGGYQGAHDPIASFVMRSEDRGVNWSYHSTIAHDRSGSRDYDEPTMVTLNAGGLLCVLRSHESPRSDPPGGYLYMATSDDAGATWTKAQKTSMWGHPAHLLRLEDGRVLCTYGYRMHPEPGVRACVSVDGLTWKPQDIFSVRALPDLDSERLQIGCPSSLELERGKVLTAYHIWTQNKTTEGSQSALPERQFLEASLYRI